MIATLSAKLSSMNSFKFTSLSHNRWNSAGAMELSVFLLSNDKMQLSQIMSSNYVVCRMCPKNKT